MTQRVLLVLTVLGFVVPNALLVAFVAGEGVDAPEYLSHWAEGLPSVQATLDLVIAALAFLVWGAMDARRSGVDRWWVAIPATLLVGLCFGLPLYLLMRERALAATAASA